MTPSLQQALRRLQSGDFAEAERLFTLAVGQNPADVNALFLFGLMRAQQGRFGDALALFDRAIAVDAGDARLHAKRALVLSHLGRYEDALASYDQALALEPGDAVCWNDRAVVLRRLGRLEQALASLDRALGAAPGFAAAFYLRGSILRALGRPRDALANMDRALRLEPRHVEAWHERGVILSWDLRRHAEALPCFDRALALNPRHAAALNNRAGALRELGRFDEAEASFDRAISADPDAAAIYVSRSSLLGTAMGKFAPAIRDLETALRLEPDHDFALGDLLHLKMYCGDWRDFDEHLARIDAGVRAGRRVIGPFAYEGLARSPADLQACARTYAACKFPPAAAACARARRRPAKIRLGYVSGEFREQATQHLAVGLYEAHDRDRFDVVALDNGQADDSPMRRRLESAFDKFIDISALSDGEAAARVMAEDIDVLINLNGYFGAQRMSLFALRPAPVQVNFLGFPGTLGAPYLDYILADRRVIPEDEQGFYDEKVVYLPDSYQVNDSRRPMPVAASSRAEHGLPDTGFVFCHFNQSYKLTPATFAIWMRLLARVEGSVLWLLQSSGPFADNLRREAQRQGVAAGRLVFAPMTDHGAHMARLGLGDLFLDSLPYNAHTTASDALWAGLPLVTCPGSTFPGRVAASLLHAAGLPELVADDLEAYENLAFALATRADRLAAIRGKLARSRADAPLFDTARFTRHIEDAYEGMIERWARGEAPAGFSVAPRP